MTPPNGPICRFAPSTTGLAHPGTMASALLAWLDARQRGATFVLRLENLDTSRCKPEFARWMLEDLAWLGLNWDHLEIQSDAHTEHRSALRQLAERGLLYACDHSRKSIRNLGHKSPDGGFAYPNLCRSKVISPDTLNAVDSSIRLQLPNRTYQFGVGPNQFATQNPAQEMGDPVVRRQDGSVAYNLAVVLDDARLGVTHIVRGLDIAASTATHLAIYQLLDLPPPQYIHHPLLLEEGKDKLAKLHGSVSIRDLKKRHTAQEICGFICRHLGLSGGHPCLPQDLVESFDWALVQNEDVLWNILDAAQSN